jgi:type VI secretion system protein VasD
MTQSSPARLIIIALLACMTFGLVACGSTPKKPSLIVSISAGADVNPDLESRASPVVLHVLELTAIDEFNRADYFSLTQDDASALGVDVVNRTEIILTPGSQKSLTLELDEKIAYLGFVAGYRDIDNSRWRISQEITPGTTEHVTVSLGKDQVSVVEIKD